LRLFAFVSSKFAAYSASSTSAFSYGRGSWCPLLIILVSMWKQNTQCAPAPETSYCPINPLQYHSN